MRFLLRDNKATFSNIIHFKPTVFTFYLQKDKWHPGFNGMMAKWALNFGDGAFKTDNFWEGEAKDINFAYKDGSTSQK